ncbi:fasciclin domain-containing protein [Sphingomonas sp. FW199]|uniref:fasciclin domain-containing protein n=1 Tax=Sphingomonas sp. FW199 TaxID=3400217 RepID=UPI003CF57224
MRSLSVIAKLAAVSAFALTAAAANAQQAEPQAPAQTEAPAPTTTADPATTTTAPADTTTQTAQPAAPATADAAAPGGTIVDAAVATPTLSTLVTAVQAAGLADTLKGPGPFTVFAPTNEAFGRLAPGTVDTLLKPENKATLSGLLTYHVVAGELDSAKLVEQLKANNGSVTLTTVAGQPLTATLENNAIILTDANGNKSYVTQYDVKQANGVVHVVNGVLIPKQEAQAAQAPAAQPSTEAADATAPAQDGATR